MSLASVTAGLAGLALHLFLHVPGPPLTLIMSCAMAAGIAYQSPRPSGRFKTICWIAGVIGLMSAVLLLFGKYHVPTLLGVFLCTWIAVRRPEYRLAGLMALFPTTFILGISPDWHAGVNAVLQQFIVVPVAWFTIVLLLWLPGKMRIRRALSLYASSLAGTFAALRRGGVEGRRAAQEVPMDFMLMVDRLICEREYDFASLRYYSAASVELIRTLHALSRVAALLARHSAGGRPGDAWLRWVESRLDRVAECLRERETIALDLGAGGAPLPADAPSDARLEGLMRIAERELDKLDKLDLEAEAARLAVALPDARPNQQFIPKRGEPITLSYKRSYSLPEEYAAYDATKVATVVTSGVFLSQFLQWPYGFFIPLTCVVVYIGAFLNGSIMLRVSDRVKGVAWGLFPAVLFLATACYVNYCFVYLIPLFWFSFIYSMPILKSFCWSTAILTLFIFTKVIISNGTCEDVSLLNLNLAFFWSTAVGLLLVVAGELLLWPHLWKVDMHLFPLVRPIVVDLRAAVHLIGEVFLEGRFEDPDLWPALSYILNKLKLAAAVMDGLRSGGSRAVELERTCRETLGALFECFHDARSMSLLCQYNDRPIEGAPAEYLKSLFGAIDFRLSRLIHENGGEGEFPPRIPPRPPLDETDIVAEFADRAEGLLATLEVAEKSIGVLRSAGMPVPRSGRPSHFAVGPREIPMCRYEES